MQTNAHRRTAATRRRGGLAAALAVTAALLLAPAAHADQQWADGVYQSTTYTQCVIGTTEVGADAWTGYLVDQAKPPAPGQVFYGHVEFGAATSACNGDQQAEVDLVLPPGVALAVDAGNPIQCFYYDADQVLVKDPTCPTHATNGTYGPLLPAGDGGAAWDMPPGRTTVIDFPLKATRQLTGPAGGHCPQSVDDFPYYHQYDCLLAAVHVIDGDTDPWLAPDVQLFTGAGSAAAQVTLAVPKGQSLKRVAKQRSLAVTCTAGAAGRCAVRATIPATQARKLGLHVAGKATTYVLASGSKRLAGAGTATVKLALSHQAAAALAHARSLRVTVAATDGAATAKRSVTLKR